MAGLKRRMSSVLVQKVRVVVTGGSNADPNLLTKLHEVYRNAAVMNLYGLSETSGAVVMSPWDSDFDAGGWVHTGDLGYLDERGYIYLKGRMKEMFVQGGYNVYPVEVENLISSHPGVSMAAGIGVPDPVMGEIGRYYVVPKPGEELSPDQIVRFCKENLADYKVPKQVVVCQQLPLTPAGKVMKSKLKDDYEKNGK